MGYAVAEAARDRGAEVVLVTAPTALADPALVRTVRVMSAQDMCDARAFGNRNGGRGSSWRRRWPTTGRRSWPSRR